METISPLLAFVQGIHRSPVNSPHKGQWRGALMFSLICVWISGWVNNGEAGDLRHYRAHYDITVMITIHPKNYVDGSHYALFCYGPEEIFFPMLGGIASQALYYMVSVKQPYSI